MIATSQIRTDSAVQELRRIHDWASQNTAESRTIQYNYVWPIAGQEMLELLKISSGSLICLLGVQGIGKSTCVRQVGKELRESLEFLKEEESSTQLVVFFKWPGGEQPYEKLLILLRNQGLNLRDTVYEDLKLRATEDPAIRGKILKLLSKVSDDPQKMVTTNLDSNGEKMCSQLFEQYGSETILKNLYKIREQRRLLEKAIVSFLSASHTIMIDMRDYSTTDRRTMNTDLTGIQKLWQSIVEHVDELNVQGRTFSVPNIVFTLQKELTHAEGNVTSHYFIGKCRMLELAPFTPKQLTGAFKMEFGVADNVSDDALIFLGRLSQGVFRRFLRYLAICTESYMTKGSENPKIDASFAKRVLSASDIHQDWKEELRRLFPHQWKAAFDILVKLLDSGPMYQKDLVGRSFHEVMIEFREGNLKAEVDTKSGEEGFSESEVSRILQKLEEHGYVIREQTAKGNLVRTLELQKHVSTSDPEA
ncbi:MAG: hypothetical protein ABSE82_07685 [Nitrososphaerales archaeon]